MRGIDVIEALQNIDENLIFHAKHHKKYAPAWIRYVSVAACICCALLLGLLIINRIISPGEETVPDVLAPTEESTREDNPYGMESYAEESSQDEYAASEDYYFSDDTPLKYEIPAALNEKACIEFSADGKTMTCFDPVTRSLLDYNGGRIWWINIYTSSEFQQLDHSYDEILNNDWYGVISPSGFMYAKDEDHVYVLNTPPDLQYLPNDPESNASYLKYTEIGIEILESIISLNDLTINPHWNSETAESFFPHLYEDTSAVRWYYVTSYSTTATTVENRNTNLSLACDAINGTQLQPGETFSFNNTVGERTAAKGYREATVYTTGDNEPVLGGGVSQLASTLYYCCLYADLEIVERQGHVFHDPFIPGGMDAAVFWGSVDFRFKNNTDFPIRIRAYLSEGRLWVELMSTEKPNFSIDITQERTESNSDLTYRIARYVYDLDDNLIRTDTTEALDAMGGLGTTVYALREETAESVAEPAAAEAAPSPSIPEAPVPEESPAPEASPAPDVPAEEAPTAPTAEIPPSPTPGSISSAPPSSAPDAIPSVPQDVTDPE